MLQVIEDPRVKRSSLSNGRVLRINPNLKKVYKEEIIEWAKKRHEWEMLLTKTGDDRDVYISARQKMNIKILANKSYGEEMKEYKRTLRIIVKTQSDCDKAYEDSKVLEDNLKYKSEESMSLYI